MKNSIKVFRAKADITQEQLATALGVYRQTIIAIEKSKGRDILAFFYRDDGLR